MERRIYPIAESIMTDSVICHFSMRVCETALFLLPVWNLTVGTVNMVNLRHRAKFHGDRSNRCGDIAIFFLFFKMAAAASLDL